MEKAFNFFRVFDVSFFVPGATLLAAFAYAGIISDQQLPVQDETLRAVAAGAMAVVASFVLGLFCHGVQRLIGSWVKSSGNTSWYENLAKDKPAHSLALYFWYMRATCWNLGVAGVVVAGLAAANFLIWQAAALIIGSAFLVWLGKDFDRALRRASR